MSAGRRLADLEDQLAPAQHVLAWVAKVRDQPTLNDYVLSVLDGRGPLADIVEHVRRAVHADLAKARARSPRATSPAARRKEAVARFAEDRAGVWRAIQSTVFLYTLVLQLNSAATENALRVSLGACLSLRSHERFLRSGVPDSGLSANGPRDGPAGAAFWTAWRASARAVLDFARVETAARARTELRYFDGQDTLFPEASELVGVAGGLVEELAALVDAEAPQTAPKPRRGSPRPGSTDPDPAFDELVTARAAGLRDAAQRDALTMLGDDDRALAIAERILRSTADPSSDGGR